MNTEDFIKQATNYLSQGFSVIPVGQDKKPLIKWEEFQRRKPTEEEIRKGISGNLCRCTGYVNIVKAIENASERLNK